MVMPIPYQAVKLAPVSFNTQSRYALLTATIPTVRSLFLSLTARHLEYTSPGRATQWETGATLSASYALGAFQLSLSDSINTGGSGASASATQNLLFFSVTRSFGR